MGKEGNMRIAGISKGSIVDGPGIRAVVYFQGCKHKCPGCHNPETHPMDGGVEMMVDEIVSYLDFSHLRGVTLSGGDPFFQAAEAATLARKINSMGFDVVTYTGFTWEQLVRIAESDQGFKALIEASWLIVDGPYIEAQRHLNLAHRGSKNQRIIDVKRSLEANAAVLWEPPSYGPPLPTKAITALEEAMGKTLEMSTV
jgi:anaerobic ribonucleoside-triphosphate reductase activating protein